MKKLTAVEILDYYDYPILFSAKDGDQNYICSFTRVIESEIEFICVPVSEAQLKGFLNGELDLNWLYTQSKEDFYLITTGKSDEEGFEAETLISLADSLKLIPRPGYIYQGSAQEIKENG